MTLSAGMVTASNRLTGAGGVAGSVATVRDGSAAPVVSGSRDGHLSSRDGSADESREGHGSRVVSWRAVLDVGAGSDARGGAGAGRYEGAA